MTINIRQEQSGDSLAISNLVKTAFANVAESDHREHFLVDRLHRSESFVPQLSTAPSAIPTHFSNDLRPHPSVK